MVRSSNRETVSRTLAAMARRSLARVQRGRSLVLTNAPAAWHGNGGKA